MIRESRSKVILDACVLYPAPLRDILLSFADEGLFKPKWTDDIHEEWTRNLIKKRPDLSKEQLLLTKKAMDLAFPDAKIFDYHSLINSISLPDLKDRHVVAAAIKSKAEIIITFNLKDFPPNILSEYDIDAQHPDRFLSDIFDFNSEKSQLAFSKQVKRLKNPPKSFEQVIESLRKCGLNEICEKLK